MYKFKPKVEKTIDCVTLSNIPSEKMIKPTPKCYRCGGDHWECYNPTEIYPKLIYTTT